MTLVPRPDMRVFGGRERFDKFCRKVCAGIYFSDTCGATPAQWVGCKVISSDRLPTQLFSCPWKTAAAVHSNNIGPATKDSPDSCQLSIIKAVSDTELVATFSTHKDLLQQQGP